MKIELTFRDVADHWNEKQAAESLTQEFELLVEGWLGSKKSLTVNVHHHQHAFDEYGLCFECDATEPN